MTVASRRTMGEAVDRIVPEQVPSDSRHARQLARRQQIAGVVMAPIWSDPCSVNHSRPSGPLVIPNGALPAPGTANVLTTPAVVIAPIWSVPVFVNHNRPSCPTAMPRGPDPGARANAVTTPVVGLNAAAVISL